MVTEIGSEESLDALSEDETFSGEINSEEDPDFKAANPEDLLEDFDTGD